jgi:hypothetical protein
MAATAAASAAILASYFFSLIPPSIRKIVRRDAVNVRPFLALT